jgi:hypothetical protein
LPERVWRVLEDLARREGDSRAKIIVKAVIEYAEKRGIQAT